MSENSDINTKFKTLYDVAFHEYKDECERSKRIDEKVGRIFTVLNIFIVLAITAVTMNTGLASRLTISFFKLLKFSF